MATLLGPTASGKTDLAIELAKHLNIALISVDSAMVYRGLDIGTAKPDLETRYDFPHALVDIREPEEDYSVRSFCDEADQAVRAAWRMGKIPLLVGGSMMYFRAFREGLADLPSADADIRASIHAKAEAEGVEGVYQELKRLDPKTAAQLDPVNLRRIERALEVFRLTGKSLVDLWQEKSVDGAEDRLGCQLVEFVVPEFPRAELHTRIEQRLQAMFDRGFVGEVSRLMERPQLSSTHLSMRTVGYREVWQHLADGHQGVTHELFEKVLISTRRLARKQHTWLRQWQDEHLIPATSVDCVIEVLSP